MRRAAVLVVLGLAIAAPVRGEEVPVFDGPKHCEGLSKLFGKQAVRQACLQLKRKDCPDRQGAREMEDRFEAICNGWEEEALASLSAGAASGEISGAVLRMCADILREFGGGYAHLKRCVDIHQIQATGERVERFGY